MTLRCFAHGRAQFVKRFGLNENRRAQGPRGITTFGRIFDQKDNLVHLLILTNHSYCLKEHRVKLRDACVTADDLSGQSLAHHAASGIVGTVGTIGSDTACDADLASAATSLSSPAK